MPAKPVPAADPVPGRVLSYRVTEDRAVILTCQHPDLRTTFEVRLLPIELDSMLRRAREPQAASRGRRTR